MTDQNSKVIYRLFADLVFLIHVLVVFAIVFGWLFGGLYYYLYLTTLVLTLLSETVLGYCALTKWEFILRRKLEPTLSYDYSFLSYYTYKLLVPQMSMKAVKYSALVFLWGSLALNLIFHYV